MSFLRNQKIGVKLMLGVSVAFVLTIAIIVTLATSQFSYFIHNFSEQQVIKGMEGLEAELGKLQKRCIGICKCFGCSPGYNKRLSRRKCKSFI